MSNQALLIRLRQLASRPVKTTRTFQTLMQACQTVLSASVDSVRIFVDGKFVVLSAKMVLDEALKALGLSAEQAGDPAAVKKAYRAASMAAHPDRGGSTEAQQRVNEAYELLEKMGPARVKRPDGTLSPEEEKEVSARNKALVVDQIEKSFNPEAFRAHLEKVFGETFKIKDTVEEGTTLRGNPRTYTREVFWTSAGGTTIFSLYFSADYFSVKNIKSLGSDTGGFAASVSMVETIFHDGRKHKSKPRAWSISSHTADMTPESVWPTAKLKKMKAAPKGAAKRLFSKRDFEAGVENLLGGKLEQAGKTTEAMIPFGQAVGEKSRFYDNYFRARFYRTAFGTYGSNKASDRTAVWDLLATFAPNEGRSMAGGDRIGFIPENEETLKVLKEVQKATADMTDPKQIQGVLQKRLTAYKARLADDTTKTAAPAPIDFGIAASTHIRAAAHLIQHAKALKASTGEVDYSADETVIEYAVQTIFKKKASPASAAASTAKKLSGNSNMMIGPGIVMIDPKKLETAIFQRIANMASKFVVDNHGRFSKEDASSSALQHFYGFNDVAGINKKYQKKVIALMK